MRLKSLALFALLIVPSSGATAQSPAPQRPFGTLRDQADTQQRWLASRMSTVLPAIMRKYAVDMWVIPMREYNEDPVFTSIVSPTNLSRVFAFSDGLSAAEMEGRREALGEKWTSRFVRHDGLALDLIATRLPEETAFYGRKQELAWAIIDTAFSNAVITPGTTRTDDVRRQTEFHMVR